LTAKEVMAKGRAASIKLTESYIYNVRGAAKKKGGRARGRVAGSANAAGVAGSIETLLRAVAAEVGLGRAIDVLAAERARVRAAIGA
jgi:hypothetical protein